MGNVEEKILVIKLDNGSGNDFKFRRYIFQFRYEEIKGNPFVIIYITVKET